MNPSNALAAYRIEAITDALCGNPMTLDEMCDRVCLCREHTRRYLVHLHRSGAIHISGWPVQKTGRRTRVQEYKLGRGEDAPKPTNLTSAQRQADYMKRVRADGDRYDLHKAKNRARKLKPGRDLLVSAFFGWPGEQAKHTA